VSRGVNDLDIPHLNEKHALDDRSAVRWLMSQWRPGDVLMTTRLGWPAVWWYGGFSVADNVEAQPDRRRFVEMLHVSPGPDCRGRPLEQITHGARRLLVYFGFRDAPDGFEDLLFHDLTEIGVVTSYNEFAGLGRATVVDLGPSVVQTQFAVLARRSTSEPPLDGCVGGKPARRW
jgi:hypothetical protein